MEDAGINMEAEDPYRVGVIIGSGIGSLETVEATYNKVLEHKVNRVNPLTIPKMISNMAAGNVSIQFGLKGKCENVVTACAPGTNCIGVRRSGYHAGRWNNKLYLPYGGCRFSAADSTFDGNRQDAGFHSF